MCRGIGLVLFGLSVVFTPAFVSAAPLPPAIEQFLREKQRPDLIARFAQVQVVSPERFAWIFHYSKNREFLSAGYFGVTFRSEGHNLFKFSHAVFASLGQAQLNPARATVPQGPGVIEMRGHAWRRLAHDAAIEKMDVYAQHPGVQWGGASVLDELYGELIAAALDPTRDVILADIISSDGLALVRRFIPGVSFAQILESERQKTDLHRNYVMPGLWRQLMRYQQAGEVQLLETGTTVDMLTPGNFLVQGMGPGARLVHFDTGLVLPSPEVRGFYRSQGMKIPAPRFAGVVEAATVWPLFPQHILYSNVWDLSRKQAVDYATAWIGRKSRREIMEWMTRTPVLPITSAPHLVDTRMLDRCAAVLLKTSQSGE